MPSRFRRLLVAAAAALAVAAPAAVARPHAPAVRVTHVTVSMVEYRFVLTPKKVPLGRVVFTIVNKGQIPHDFSIQRLQQVSSLVQPGSRTTLRVTFKKPGSYYYLCTVGAHVQYGMYGNLIVTK
jgi:plastocyanin